MVVGTRESKAVSVELVERAFVVSFSGVASVNGQSHNTVLVVPFGTGNDDTTFDMRITGWTKVSTLWIPVPIIAASCTLSTAVGVASAAVTNSERFVDTITEVLAPDSAVFYSTTGNRLAWIMFDAMGFQKLEFSFDLTGATIANAIYRRL